VTRILLLAALALVSFTGVADARRSADQALGVSVDGPGTIAADGIACRDQDGDCVEVYADGTQITLTATADSGGTFAGWGGDCSAATGTTCTLTMTSAKSVTATFTAAAVEDKAPTPASSPPAPAPPSTDTATAAGATQPGSTFGVGGSSTPAPTGSATRPTATFAVRSLGKPLVVRTAHGWAVTLRFFTSRTASGSVRLWLNGRTVGAYTFPPRRGRLLVGPFDVDRHGTYRFGLTLNGAGGAVARINWTVVV
jgi:hypothetical protein